MTVSIGGNAARVLRTGQIFKRQSTWLLRGDMITVPPSRRSTCNGSNGGSRPYGPAGQGAEVSLANLGNPCQTALEGPYHTNCNVRLNGTNCTGLLSSTQNRLPIDYGALCDEFPDVLLHHNSGIANCPVQARTGAVARRYREQAVVGAFWCGCWS